MEITRLAENWIEGRGAPQDRLGREGQSLTFLTLIPIHKVSVEPDLPSPGGWGDRREGEEGAGRGGSNREILNTRGRPLFCFLSIRLLYAVGFCASSEWDRQLCH